jgi:hypothetical protein
VQRLNGELGVLVLLEVDVAEALLRDAAMVYAMSNIRTRDCLG